MPTCPRAEKAKMHLNETSACRCCYAESGVAAPGRATFGGAASARGKEPIPQPPPTCSAEEGPGVRVARIAAGFAQSIPTFACPHPNPLPEGEGDFLG